MQSRFKSLSRSAFIQTINQHPLIFIGLFSVMLTPLFAVKIWSADIWWHLATGRWIVENHTIPTTDPFSFTLKGEPWINVNWLGALLFYGAYSIGGISGIVGLKVIIGFAMIWFLSLSLHLIRIRPALLIAVVTSVIVTVQPRFSMARPSSVGAMLLALSIFLALRCEKSEDRTVLLFIPLLAVWQNLHSSALLVLPISAIVAADTFIHKKSSAHRRWTTLTVIVCGLIVLLSDRGRQVLKQALAYDTSSVIVQLTKEWQLLSIDNPSVWVPWIIFGLSVLFGAFHIRRYPIPFALAVLGTALGTRHVRHLYTGMLLVTPMAALMFQSGAELLHNRRLLLAEKAVPLLLFLAVPGLHMTFRTPVPLREQLGFSIAANRYPDDTLKYLRTLPFGKTMNDLGLGGYLIWHNMPGGVYLDGRTVQVFQEQHIKDLHLPFSKEENGINRLADQYDITYLLSRPGKTPYNAAMGWSTWIPIYFGNASVLFVRESKAETLAAKDIPLFPLVRHLNAPERMAKIYHNLMTSKAKENQFVDQVVSAAQQNSDSPILLELLFFLKYSRPDLMHRIATQLSPQSARIKQNSNARYFRLNPNGTVSMNERNIHISCGIHCHSFDSAGQAIRRIISRTMINRYVNIRRRCPFNK